MNKDVVAGNQKVCRENRNKGRSAGARLWMDLYVIMNVLNWEGNMIDTIYIT